MRREEKFTLYHLRGISFFLPLSFPTSCFTHNICILYIIRHEFFFPRTVGKIHYPIAWKKVKNEMPRFPNRYSWFRILLHFSPESVRSEREEIRTENWVVISAAFTEKLMNIYILYTTFMFGYSSRPFSFNILSELWCTNICSSVHREREQLISKNFEIVTFLSHVFIITCQIFVHKTLFIYIHVIHTTQSSTLNYKYVMKI